MLYTGGDFESDEFIIYGVLTASSRTQSFTIETKSNELVEKNRKFTIGLLHTTATFNSPLVKASPNFSSITVIIEDNDIGNIIVKLSRVKNYPFVYI